MKNGSNMQKKKKWFSWKAKGFLLPLESNEDASTQKTLLLSGIPATSKPQIPSAAEAQRRLLPALLSSHRRRRRRRRRHAQGSLFRVRALPLPLSRLLRTLPLLASPSPLRQSVERGPPPRPRAHIHRPPSEPTGRGQSGARLLIPDPPRRHPHPSTGNPFPLCVYPRTRPSPLCSRVRSVLHRRQDVRGRIVAGAAAEGISPIVARLPLYAHTVR